MKIFIHRSILYFSIIALAVVLFNNLLMEKPSGYMAAIIDKHQRINNIEKSKILLAGGSNLAFGVNSEKLEKELNMPVVNMGLHAGLGLSFIIEELKFSISEGDIVLISPEYFLSNDGLYSLKQNASDFYSEASLYYSSGSFDQLKNSLEDFRFYLQNSQRNFHSLILRGISENERVRLKRRAEDIYSRSSFNKYGDIVAHISKASNNNLNDGGLMKYRYWEGISAINNFNTYANKLHVKVFYLFPNYPISEYSKNKKIITKLHLDLRNDLKVDILNSPTDFVYPDSLFYDTVYHLTGSGREKRTTKLIELLKQKQN